MLQKIFLGNVLFNSWCLLSTVHVVQNSICPENGHPVVSKNGITLVHGDKTKTDSQENGRVWTANPSVTVLSNDT